MVFLRKFYKNMESIMSEQISIRNKNRDALIRLYNKFCIPALIIHELLHVIFIKLTFSKFLGIKIIEGEDFEFTHNLSIGVFYVPGNSFKKFIISISPIFSFFIPYILFSLELYYSFVFFSIYMLLCLRVFLPSKEDIAFAIGEKQYEI